MSLNPKLKRILLPPSIPRSTLFGSSKLSQQTSSNYDENNIIEVAATSLAAQIDLNTATAKANTSENTSPTPPLQRFLTLHPSKPLIAYILNPVDVSISTNIEKIVVVQNTVSKEIIVAMSWIDLSAVLYGETDIKKLPAAAKSLGVIQSIQFYDPAVVFWSRLMTTSAATSTAASDRFESLAIQTDKRVILLNLRKGSRGTQVWYNSTFQQPSNQSTKKSPFRTILAHLCEKTIGAIPSSNILPLTDRWVLFGCVDGSMKCYDWTTGSTVKKIKGLGKVDSIVKLLSANRYSSDPTTLSSQGLGGLRRILTVSKKGIVYLIEIEIDVEKNTIDIQPPLGRFYIGSPVEVPPADAFVSTETTKDSSNIPEQGAIMEHCIISYDAHMDRLLWLTPRNKHSQTLSVWNLRALQQDFIQQANLASSSGSSSKNLFKPDPSLVIQFPTTTSAAISATVAVIAAHPAFTADTIVCITVSNTGDLFLHAAIGLAANTTQTVFATPVHGISLTSMLINAVPALGEQNELRQTSGDTSIVRVHAALSQPLPSSGSSDVIVATNMGLFILDLPIFSNQGTHHCHFGSGLGALSRSVLMAQHSNIDFATVDALTGNPIGLIEPKNQTTVYESPIASNMPQEFQKRPFRNPPTFLTSPSGIYVCLLWSAEFRYEILHIPTVLQKLGQRSGTSNSGVDPVTTPTRSPVVASGSGVADFAWIGDDDLFCILYAGDLMELAANDVPQKVDAEGGLFSLTPNFKQLGASAFNVATLATSATKSATSGALSATKLATSATMTVTKGATSAGIKTVGVAKEGVKAGAKVVSKSVKKSFKMFGVGKKKKSGNEETGTSITADDEEDESESGGISAINVPSAADLAALELSMKHQPQVAETQTRYVELKKLEGLESEHDPAAKSLSLGEIVLRGGSRSLPTALFGGPVLCVASQGQAHFYTRKKNEKEIKASSYISSGPTLPCPNLITWDDDGRLCAIVVENRVAVYISSEPDFILLGAVRITSPSVPGAEVTSIRFVHGALYCCTWNSVHCILLGDLEGGICLFDTFLLASTDVPVIPPKTVHDDRFTFLSHCPTSLPLVQPTVLGYQSGSLLVSTLRAVSLNSPLLRIGLLLAEGQTERASKWFEAVPNFEHEALAAFLERRGRPEMAMQLSGLSLETIIDMSMRFGYVDRLEESVETFGVTGLRSIDMGRGLSPNIFGPELTTHSIVVCVGAYLLAHGRVELTRRLATECLRSGEEGRKDAFFLGTLLLPVDEADASRLITRAVEEVGPISDDWLIGKFVRDHVLKTSATRRS